jgi:2'-5' RNA ligase
MEKISFSGQKVFHTALVIIPPVEVWPQIQNIRKVHDSAFDRWMPHINLCFPFISPEEFDLFFERFSEVFKDFEKFSIKFSGLGHFDHAKKAVLWADPVTKMGEINEIYGRIVKELGYLKENRDFNPHLTLGQFEKGAVERKKEEFMKDWKEISFEVEEIHLIQRDGQNSPFYIKKSIKFKSN